MQSYEVRKKTKKCYFYDYHDRLVDLSVPCFNLHSFLIVHEVMSPLVWLSSLIRFLHTASVARVCCDWLE